MGYGGYGRELLVGLIIRIHDSNVANVVVLPFSGGTQSMRDVPLYESEPSEEIWTEGRMACQVTC